MAASDALQPQLFPVSSGLPPRPAKKQPPTPQPPAYEVFHGSLERQKEYLRAPAMHVGDARAAYFMAGENLKDAKKTRWVSNEDVEPLVKAFDFSEHAQFHDVELTDVEANRAHSSFLRSHGLTPTTSVHSSTLALSFDPTPSEERVRGAVEALKQNKILKYRNTKDLSNDDIGDIVISREEEGIDTDEEPYTESFVVPSPWINLRRSGRRDPMKQPVLPMDYSQINPSERTQAELKQRKERL